MEDPRVVGVLGFGPGVGRFVVLDVLGVVPTTVLEAQFTINREGAPTRVQDYVQSLLLISNNFLLVKLFQL